MNAEVTADNLPAASEEGLRSLPFAFAQQYGVLTQWREGKLYVLYRPGLKTETVIELRRFFNSPLVLEKIEDGQFQQRLSLAYQKDNNEAIQVAEDLGADVDLSRLADEIPETGI